MGTFAGKLARLLKKVAEKLEHTAETQVKTQPDATQANGTEPFASSHTGLPVEPPHTDWHAVPGAPAPATTVEKKIQEITQTITGPVVVTMSTGATPTANQTKKTDEDLPSPKTFKPLSRTTIQALPPSRLHESRPKMEPGKSGDEKKTPAAQQDENSRWVRVSGEINIPKEVQAELLALKPDSAEDKSADEEPETKLAGAWQGEPLDTLLMQTSPTEESFKKVAGNPNTNGSTLNWLAGQIAPEIRAIVGGNPNCPQETLRRLSNDQEATVRLAVAGNKFTGSDILRTLSKDPSSLVSGQAQTAMAKRLHTTSEVETSGAGLLAMNKFKTTSNQMTASYTNLQCVKDDDGWHSLGSDSAKIAYKQQKDTVKDLKFNASSVYNRSGPKPPKRNIVEPSEKDTIAFLTMVGGRATTPDARLIELAAHENEKVRCAVAENNCAPSEIFYLLAKDSSREVRLRVAENENCPQDILETLEKDEDLYVAHQAKLAGKRGLAQDKSANRSDTPK
jgi:hypothetical protein